VYVTPVPKAVLAASERAPNTTTPSLITVNLDGSGYLVRSPTTGQSTLQPSWAPAGRILFTRYDPVTFAPSIMRSDPGLPAAAHIASGFGARSSANGVIYYSVFNSSAGTYELWRADANGLNVAHPTGCGNCPGLYGFPSPDGSALAYETYPTRNVARLSLADGSGPVLIPGGGRPHYSPDGRKIAFWRSSEIWVRDLATGAELRISRETDTTSASFDYAPLAWTPDSKYVLARGYVPRFDARFFMIYLLNASQVELMPLAWSTNLSEPALRTYP
jgi:Tol biopolymer transport system component